MFFALFYVGSPPHRENHVALASMVPGVTAKKAEDHKAATC